MKSSELLIKAKAVISDPANWTQNAFARDKEGMALAGGYDPVAVCWCSFGAAEKVVEKDYYDAIIEKPFSYFKRNIAQYNDDNSHKVVMAMWDEAIANALAAGD